MVGVVLVGRVFVVLLWPCTPVGAHPIVYIFFILSVIWALIYGPIWVCGRVPPPSYAYWYVQHNFAHYCGFRRLIPFPLRKYSSFILIILPLRVFVRNVKLNYQFTKASAVGTAV